MISKIVHRPDLRLIYAFSGNVDQIAARAGRLLEENAKARMKPEKRRELLLKAGRGTLSESDYAEGDPLIESGSLIVIFYAPETDMWKLNIRGAEVSATPCRPVALGGFGNLAMYLPVRFYEPRSVADLKFLAAYTILEGNHCNSSIVDGLELCYAAKGGKVTQKVMQVDPDGDQADPDTEMEAIRKRAKSFREDMRRALLAPSIQHNG
jgi:hypothetical protein